MSRHPTIAAPVLMPALFRLLAAYRPAVGQERVLVRLIHLTLAQVLALGRHTVSQLLVVLGVSGQDWSAWYRLFNRPRLDLARVQTILLGQILGVLPALGPVVAVVDATQLPRTSRTLPGVGWTVAPHTPKWRRGIHLAQRYVGLSLLLPQTEAGDSRALPLRWLLLRTAKTAAMGDAPERKETTGAVALVAWLRARLDAAGRTAQELLVLGDGTYSTAPVLATWPARTVLWARCATNRALYALPSYRPGPGRQRRYGDRGPTPQQTLHTPDGWADYSFPVRGRSVTVTAKLTGPWLVHGAPFHPVMLVVVRGVERGKGTTRRQREPQFFLVSVTVPTEDEWALAMPLPALLGWAWQRWEVEVMHRELKSGFGLGEQQAWSDRGAATVVPWVVWTYALLVLAGYQTWGLGPAPGPRLARWHAPRRWSFGRLWQTYRAELWQLGAFQPVWRRSPDTWAEIHAWVTTQTNAALGMRRR